MSTDFLLVEEKIFITLKTGNGTAQTTGIQIVKDLCVSKQQKCHRLKYGIKESSLTTRKNVKLSNRICHPKSLA